MSERLDLRGIPCPANSARALIAMELLEEGEEISIWVDDGEPILNLPASLVQQGHRILKQERTAEGHWIVTASVGS